MARYRIRSRTDGLSVTFEPAVSQPTTVATGQTIQFDSDQDFVVTATGPIQLTQTMFGQDALGATTGGDPSMGTGIPWSQTRASYDFLVPTTYTTNWLSLVAPAGSTVRLDGTILAGWSAIGTSGYEATRVAVNVGSHHVESDDGASFMITAYG